MTKQEHFDIHQHITDQIVAVIERGAGELRTKMLQSSGFCVRQILRDQVPRCEISSQCGLGPRTVQAIDTKKGPHQATPTSFFAPPSVMPEQGKQDNYRQWNADEPQKCASPQTHDHLLFIILMRAKRVLVSISSCALPKLRARLLL